MTRDLVGLAAFIDARQIMPHDWNTNCCVRFMLGAVASQFGSAPSMRVDWQDRRTARRAIAKVGGIEAETDRLFASIEPASAQTGDIGGVIDPADGFVLTIVHGPHIIAPGEHGIERQPRSAMVRAWRAAPSKGIIDG